MSEYVEAPSCVHNPDYECFDCGTRRHLALHPALDQADCLSCKLTSVRIYGRFTGTASMSDAVQEFWHTGDAAVFDRQDEAAIRSRIERATRIG